MFELLARRGIATVVTVEDLVPSAEHRNWMEVRLIKTQALYN